LSSFAQADTVVIGISVDDVAAQTKFVQQNQLNFPLLCDTEKNRDQSLRGARR
jgi:peroxiredoxin